MNSGRRSNQARFARNRFRAIVALPAAILAGSLSFTARAEIHFSHDGGTIGLAPPPASAVFNAPDVQDIFATTLALGGPGAAGNTLVADNPFAFGLQPGDNIDAIHDDGVRLFGNNGLWNPSFVFSARPGAMGQNLTPVNLEMPFNAADLYQVGSNQGHLLLNRADQFGLSKANLDESVDGLALEPGTPFAFGRRVHFSLAPGSPTLLNNGWSAADVLTALVGIPGTLAVSLPAANLGLEPGDDLDGLIIYQAVDADGDGRLDGPDDQAVAYFSVAAGSIGAVNTDVRAEALGNGAANDIFQTGTLFDNTLIVDGIGWTKLHGLDDIDALDVFQVFSGNPPFLTFGALPPRPTRDPATLPPGYQANPNMKPIGAFYIPVCATPLPKIVNWEFILKLCAPDGTSVQIVRNGRERVVGPNNAATKAGMIAAAIRGITIPNPGDPIEDAKAIFAAVAVSIPPVKVNAPGVVAEVCVVISQDFIDRGWALDGVCLSFTNWTMSIVLEEELAFGPPPPLAIFYQLPSVKLLAAPEQDGFVRLSFWDGIFGNPNLLHYVEPFSAGQDPLSILQNLRTQIVDSGGDAELDGNRLVIAMVPVEPDPSIFDEAGPYMYEAGAIDNDMPVIIDMRGTATRVNLLGCGGYLTGLCCEASGAAGCSNAECCEQVCAVDPFCCENAWDQICADAASSLDVCGCQPPPPNDECETPLLFDPGSEPFRWVEISTPSKAPPPCGIVGIQKDAWFAFIAPCTGTALLTIFPNFDMVAALYQQCPSAGGEAFACMEAAAGHAVSIDLPVVAGEQVILQIGMLGGNQGDGVIDLTMSCPNPCPGDITGNLTVNVDDLLQVINSWGPCNEPCPADIAPPGPPQGDGVVNVDDLLVVINNWGPCK